jgi:DNA-binding winged helix-turn-helix (wHTH) protein
MDSRSIHHQWEVERKFAANLCELNRLDGRVKGERTASDAPIGATLGLKRRQTFVVETLRSRRLVKFSDFEVDLQTGELRKAGMRLKLTGQPFQVLAILLEHAGEVITREELQKQLWPNTFVDVNHNLNTAINKIREALGDSSENPRFVETLPRRGYRFIAPVTVNGTAAAAVADAAENRPTTAEPTARTGALRALA